MFFFTFVVFCVLIDVIMEKALLLLKKFFGYDSFRTGQAELIKAILQGSDCLGIMPTGSGKSICYQIPALVLGGTTLVISPLISLMKDQVDNLNEMGISATFINSSLSSHDYMQTIENASLGMYNIIYVAPERFNSDLFLRLLSSIHIPLIAIDEAHCVSQWGHDFRPSYTEIASMIAKLEVRPIVAAFTATATKPVAKDIISCLHLVKPFTLTTGFDRKNLSFQVVHSKNKMYDLTTYLNFELEKIGIKCYTEPENSFGVIAFNIGDLDSGEVASILNEKYDICVRGGYHCAPIKHKALGTLSQGAVRVSISYFNTFSEIQRLIYAVKQIKKHLK